MSKQHITIKQLAELSNKALEKLKMEFYPPYYQLQIIDKRILQNQKAKSVIIYSEGNTYVYFPKSAEFYPLPSVGQMLDFLEGEENRCDSLWKKFKKKIEK